MVQKTGLRKQSSVIHRWDEFREQTLVTPRGVVWQSAHFLHVL